MLLKGVGLRHGDYVVFGGTGRMVGGRLLSRMRYEEVTPFADVKKAQEDLKQDNPGWDAKGVFKIGNVLYKLYDTHKGVQYKMRLSPEGVDKYQYKGWKNRAVMEEDIKGGDVTIICKSDKILKGLALLDGVPNIRQDFVVYKDSFVSREQALICGPCPWTGSRVSLNTMAKLMEVGVTQEELDVVAKYLYSKDTVNLNPPTPLDSDEKNQRIFDSLHINRVDERSAKIVELKKRQLEGAELYKRKFGVDRRVFFDEIFTDDMGCEPDMWSARLKHLEEELHFELTKQKEEAEREARARAELLREKASIASSSRNLDDAFQSLSLSKRGEDESFFSPIAKKDVKAVLPTPAEASLLVFSEGKLSESKSLNMKERGERQVKKTESDELDDLLLKVSKYFEKEDWDDYIKARNRGEEKEFLTKKFRLIEEIKNSGYFSRSYGSRCKLVRQAGSEWFTVEVKHKKKIVVVEKEKKRGATSTDNSSFVKRMKPLRPPVIMIPGVPGYDPIKALQVKEEERREREEKVRLEEEKVREREENRARRLKAFEKNVGKARKDKKALSKKQKELKITALRRSHSVPVKAEKSWGGKNRDLLSSSYWRPKPFTLGDVKTKIVNPRCANIESGVTNFTLFGSLDQILHFSETFDKGSVRMVAKANDRGEKESKNEDKKSPKKQKGRPKKKVDSQAGVEGVDLKPRKSVTESKIDTGIRRKSLGGDSENKSGSTQFLNQSASSSSKDIPEVDRNRGANNAVVSRPLRNTKLESKKSTNSQSSSGGVSVKADQGEKPKPKVVKTKVDKIQGVSLSQKSTQNLVSGVLTRAKSKIINDPSASSSQTMEVPTPMRMETGSDPMSPERATEQAGQVNKSPVGLKKRKKAYKVKQNEQRDSLESIGGEVNTRVSSSSSSSQTFAEALREALVKDEEVEKARANSRQGLLKAEQDDPTPLKRLRLRSPTFEDVKMGSPEPKDLNGGEIMNRELSTGDASQQPSLSALSTPQPLAEVQRGSTDTVIDCLRVFSSPQEEEAKSNSSSSEAIDEKVKEEPAESVEEGVRDEADDVEIKKETDAISNDEEESVNSSSAGSTHGVLKDEIMEANNLSSSSSLQKEPVYAQSVQAYHDIYMRHIRERFGDDESRVDMTQIDWSEIDAQYIAKGEDVEQLEEAKMRLKSQIEVMMNEVENRNLSSSSSVGVNCVDAACSVERNESRPALRLNDAVHAEEEMEGLDDEYAFLFVKDKYRDDNRSETPESQWSMDTEEFAWEDRMSKEEAHKFAEAWRKRIARKRALKEHLNRENRVSDQIMSDEQGVIMPTSTIENPTSLVLVDSQIMVSNSAASNSNAIPDRKGCESASKHSEDDDENPVPSYLRNMDLFTPSQLLTRDGKIRSIRDVERSESAFWRNINRREGDEGVVTEENLLKIMTGSREDAGVLKEEWDASKGVFGGSPANAKRANRFNRWHLSGCRPEFITSNKFYRQYDIGRFDELEHNRGVLQELFGTNEEKIRVSMSVDMDKIRGLYRITMGGEVPSMQTVKKNASVWKETYESQAQDLKDLLSFNRGVESNILECKYIAEFRLGTILHQVKLPTSTPILITDLFNEDQSGDKWVIMRVLLTSKEICLLREIRNKWVYMRTDMMRGVIEWFDEILGRQGWKKLFQISAWTDEDRFHRSYGDQYAIPYATRGSAKERLCFLTWLIAYQGAEGCEIKDYWKKATFEGDSLMGIKPIVKATPLKWQGKEITPLTVGMTDTGVYRNDPPVEQIKGEDEQSLKEVHVKVISRDISIMEKLGVSASDLRNVLYQNKTIQHLQRIDTSKGVYYTRVTREHLEWWWLMRNWKVSITADAYKSRLGDGAWTPWQMVERLSLIEGWYSSFLLHTIWEREFALTYLRIPEVRNDVLKTDIDSQLVTNFSKMTIVDEVANALLDVRLSYDPIIGDWGCQPKETPIDYGDLSDVGISDKLFCDSGIVPEWKRIGINVSYTAMVDLADTPEQIKGVSTESRLALERILVENIAEGVLDARRMLLDLETESLKRKFNLLNMQFIDGREIQGWVIKMRNYGYWVIDDVKDFIKETKKGNNGYLMKEIMELLQSFIKDSTDSHDLMTFEKYDKLQAGCMLIVNLLAYQQNFDVIGMTRVKNSHMMGLRRYMGRDERRDKEIPHYLHLLSGVEDTVFDFLGQTMNVFRQRFKRQSVLKLARDERTHLFVHPRAMLKMIKRVAWVIFKVDINMGCYKILEGGNFKVPQKMTERLTAAEQYLSHLGFFSTTAWRESLVSRLQIVLDENRKNQDDTLKYGWRLVDADTLVFMMRVIMSAFYKVDLFTGLVVPTVTISRLTENIIVRERISHALRAFELEFSRGGVDQCMKTFKKKCIQYITPTNDADLYVEVIEPSLKRGEEDDQSELRMRHFRGDSDDSDKEDGGRSDDSDDEDGGDESYGIKGRNRHRANNLSSSKVKGGTHQGKEVKRAGLLKEWSPSSEGVDKDRLSNLVVAKVVFEDVNLPLIPQFKTKDPWLSIIEDVKGWIASSSAKGVEVPLSVTKMVEYTNKSTAIPSDDEEEVTPKDETKPLILEEVKKVLESQKEVVAGGDDSRRNGRSQSSSSSSSSASSGVNNKKTEEDKAKPDDDQSMKIASAPMSIVMDKRLLVSTGVPFYEIGDKKFRISWTLRRLMWDLDTFKLTLHEFLRRKRGAEEANFNLDFFPSFRNEDLYRRSLLSMIELRSRIYQDNLFSMIWQLEGVNEDQGQMSLNHDDSQFRLNARRGELLPYAIDERRWLSLRHEAEDSATEYVMVFDRVVQRFLQRFVKAQYGPLEPFEPVGVWLVDMLIRESHPFLLGLPQDMFLELFNINNLEPEWVVEFEGVLERNLNMIDEVIDEYRDGTVGGKRKWQVLRHLIQERIEGRSHSLDIFLYEDGVERLREMVSDSLRVPGVRGLYVVNGEYVYVTREAPSLPHPRQAYEDCRETIDRFCFLQSCQNIEGVSFLKFKREIDNQFDVGGDLANNIILGEKQDRTADLGRWVNELWSDEDDPLKTVVVRVRAKYKCPLAMPDYKIIYVPISVIGKLRSAFTHVWRCLRVQTYVTMGVGYEPDDPSEEFDRYTVTLEEGWSRSYEIVRRIMKRNGLDERIWWEFDRPKVDPRCSLRERCLSFLTIVVDILGVENVLENLEIPYMNEIRRNFMNDSRFFHLGMAAYRCRSVPQQELIEGGGNTKNRFDVEDDRKLITLHFYHETHNFEGYRGFRVQLSSYMVYIIHWIWVAIQRRSSQALARHRQAGVSVNMVEEFYRVHQPYWAMIEFIIRTASRMPSLDMGVTIDNDNLRSLRLSMDGPSILFIMEVLLRRVVTPFVWVERDSFVSSWTRASRHEITDDEISRVQDDLERCARFHTIPGVWRPNMTPEQSQRYEEQSGMDYYHRVNRGDRSIDLKVAPSVDVCWWLSETAWVGVGHPNRVSMVHHDEPDPPKASETRSAHRRHRSIGYQISENCIKGIKKRGDTKGEEIHVKKDKFADRAKAPKILEKARYEVRGEIRRLTGRLDTRASLYKEQGENEDDIPLLLHELRYNRNSEDSERRDADYERHVRARGYDSFLRDNDQYWGDESILNSYEGKNLSSVFNQWGVTEGEKRLIRSSDSHPRLKLSRPHGSRAGVFIDFGQTSCEYNRFWFFEKCEGLWKNDYRTAFDEARESRDRQRARAERRENDDRSRPHQLKGVQDNGKNYNRNNNDSGRDNGYRGGHMNSMTPGTNFSSQRPSRYDEGDRSRGDFNQSRRDYPRSPDGKSEVVSWGPYQYRYREPRQDESAACSVNKREDWSDMDRREYRNRGEDQRSQYLSQTPGQSGVRLRPNNTNSTDDRDFNRRRGDQDQGMSIRESVKEAQRQVNEINNNMSSASAVIPTAQITLVGPNVSNNGPRGVSSVDPQSARRVVLQSSAGNTPHTNLKKNEIRGGTNQSDEEGPKIVIEGKEYDADIGEYFNYEEDGWVIQNDEYRSLSRMSSDYLEYVMSSRKAPPTEENFNYDTFVCYRTMKLIQKKLGCITEYIDVTKPVKITTIRGDEDRQMTSSRRWRNQLGDSKTPRVEPKLITDYRIFETSDAFARMQTSTPPKDNNGQKGVMSTDNRGEVSQNKDIDMKEDEETKDRHKGNKRKSRSGDECKPSSKPSRKDDEDQDDRKGDQSNKRGRNNSNNMGNQQPNQKGQQGSGQRNLSRNSRGGRRRLQSGDGAGAQDKNGLTNDVPVKVTGPMLHDWEVEDPNEVKIHASPERGVKHEVKKKELKPLTEEQFKQQQMEARVKEYDQTIKNMLAHTIRERKEIREGVRRATAESEMAVEECHTSQKGEGVSDPKILVVKNLGDLKLERMTGSDDPIISNLIKDKQKNDIFQKELEEEYERYVEAERKKRESYLTQCALEREAKLEAFIQGVKKQSEESRKVIEKTFKGDGERRRLAREHYEEAKRTKEKVNKIHNEAMRSSEKSQSMPRDESTAEDSEGVRYGNLASILKGEESETSREEKCERLSADDPLLKMMVSEANFVPRVGNIEETEEVNATEMQREWWCSDEKEVMADKQLKSILEGKDLYLKQEEIVKLIKKATSMEDIRGEVSVRREACVSNFWKGWSVQHREQHLKGVNDLDLLRKMEVGEDEKYRMLRCSDEYMRAYDYLSDTKDLHRRDWLQLELQQSGGDSLIVSDPNEKPLTFHRPIASLHDYVSTFEAGVQIGSGELSMIGCTQMVKVCVFSHYAENEKGWSNTTVDRQGCKIASKLCKKELLLRRVEGEVYLPITKRILDDFTMCIRLWPLLTNKDVAMLEGVLRVMLDSAFALGKTGWGKLTGLEFCRLKKREGVLTPDQEIEWLTRRRDIFLIIFQIVQPKWVRNEEEKKGYTFHSLAIRNFAKMNRPVRQFVSKVDYNVFPWSGDRYKHGNEYVYDFQERLKSIQEGLLQAEGIDKIESLTRWGWQGCNNENREDKSTPYFARKDLMPLIALSHEKCRTAQFLWTWWTENMWIFWKYYRGKGFEVKEAFDLIDSSWRGEKNRRDILRVIMTRSQPEITCLVSMILTLTRGVFANIQGSNYFPLGHAWWTTYGVLAPQGKSTTWGGFISRFAPQGDEIPQDFKVSMDADSDKKCEILWGETFGRQEGIFHHLELKRLSDNFRTARRILLLSKIRNVDLRCPIVFNMLSIGQQNLVAKDRCDGKLHCSVRRADGVCQMLRSGAPGEDQERDKRKEDKIPEHLDIRYHKDEVASTGGNSVVALQVNNNNVTINNEQGVYNEAAQEASGVQSASSSSKEISIPMNKEMEMEDAEVRRFIAEPDVFIMQTFMIDSTDEQDIEVIKRGCGYVKDKNFHMNVVNILRDVRSDLLIAMRNSTGAEKKDFIMGRVKILNSLCVEYDRCSQEGVRKNSASAMSSPVSVLNKGQLDSQLNGGSQQTKPSIVYNSVMMKNNSNEGAPGGVRFVPTIESIQFSATKDLNVGEGANRGVPVTGLSSQLEGGSQMIATPEGLGVMDSEEKVPFQDSRTLQQGLEWKQKVYGDGNTFNKDNYDRTYRQMGNLPAPGVAVPKGVPLNNRSEFQVGVNNNQQISLVNLIKLIKGWYVTLVNKPYDAYDQQTLEELAGEHWDRAFGLTLEVDRDTLIFNTPPMEFIQWGYLPYHGATMRRLFGIKRSNLIIPIHQDTRLCVIDFGNIACFSPQKGRYIHQWKPFLQCETSIDDLSIRSMQNLEIKALSEEFMNKKYHGVVKEMKRRIESILKPASGSLTVLEKEMDWDIEPDILSNIVDMQGDLMGRDVLGVTAILEIKASFLSLLSKWNYKSGQLGRSSSFSTFLKGTVVEAFRLLANEALTGVILYRTQRARLWVWMALAHPKEGFYTAVLAALGNYLINKNETSGISKRRPIRNVYVGMCAATMYLALLLRLMDPNKFGVDSAITRLLAISRIFTLLDSEMVHQESTYITGIPEAKEGPLLVSYDLLLVLNALRDCGLDLSRQEIERALAITRPRGEEDWPFNEPRQFPLEKREERVNSVERLVPLYQAGMINSFQSMRVSSQQSKLPEEVDIRPYVAIALQAVALTLDLVPQGRGEIIPVCEEIHLHMQAMPIQVDVQHQTAHRYNTLALITYFCPVMPKDRLFINGWSTVSGTDSFNVLNDIWKKMSIIPEVWRGRFASTFDQAEIDKSVRLKSWKELVRRSSECELNETPGVVKGLKRGCKFDAKNELIDHQIKNEGRVNMAQDRRDRSQSNSKQFVTTPSERQGRGERGGFRLRSQTPKYNNNQEQSSMNKIGENKNAGVSENRTYERGRSRTRPEYDKEVRANSWKPPLVQDRNRDQGRVEGFNKTTEIVKFMYDVIGIQPSDGLDIGPTNIGRRKIIESYNDLKDGLTIKRGGGWTLACGPPFAIEIPHSARLSIFKGCEHLITDFSMDKRVEVDELFVERAQALGIWPPCYVWRKNIEQMTRERRFCSKPFCSYIHVDMEKMERGAKMDDNRKRYLSRSQGMGMLIDMTGEAWEREWTNKTTPSKKLKKTVQYLAWLMKTIEKEGKEHTKIVLENIYFNKEGLGVSDMDVSLFWKWNMGRFASLFPQATATHMSLLLDESRYIPSSEKVIKITTWNANIGRRRQESRFSSMSGRSARPPQFLNNKRRESVSSVNSFNSERGVRQGRVQGCWVAREVREMMDEAQDYDRLQDNLDNPIDLGRLRRHYFEGGRVEMMDLVYQEAEDMIVIDTGASWTVMTERFAKTFLAGHTRVQLKNPIKIRVADESVYKCKEAIDVTYNLPIFKGKDMSMLTHRSSGGWEDCELEEAGYMRITDRVYILPVNCIQPILWGAIITERLRCVMDCESGRCKIKTPEGYRVILWGKNEFRLWQMPLIFEDFNSSKAKWGGEVISQSHSRTHLITSRTRIQISKRSNQEEFEALGASFITKIKEPSFNVFRGDLEHLQAIELKDWEKKNIIKMREMMKELQDSRMALMTKLNEHDLILDKVQSALFEIHADKTEIGMYPNINGLGVQRGESSNQFANDSSSFEFEEAGESHSDGEMSTRRLRHEETGIEDAKDDSNKPGGVVDEFVKGKESNGTKISKAKSEGDMSESLCDTESRSEMGGESRSRL